VLAAISTAPAAAAAAWLLVGMPLLLMGAYRPVPVLLLAPLAAVATGWAVGRRAMRAATAIPWWPVVALLLLATAAVLVAGATHAEQLVLRRDPAAYTEIGHWIGLSGQRPVPLDWSAFGGRDVDLGSGSPAFYPRGDVVVPQFMSGLPMLLAVGQWFGGWTGLFLVPAICAGLAVLAFGGLAARTIGAGWAPLAALTLAAALPVLHTANGTYSEPLAQLVLLGGLCLLLDGLRRVDRSLAFVAGIVLGTATVVRVDALREVVLLIPVVIWLAVRGRPEARPLGIGLLLGATAGVVDGLFGSRPYILSIKGSVIPLVVGGVVVTAAGWYVVRRARRRGLPPMPAWLPTAGMWAVVVVGIALALRPLFITERSTANRGAVFAVQGLQRQQGLVEDPTRTYSEHTVQWLAWWIGPIALVLAVAGAALIVRAVLRGRAPQWTPLMILLLGTTAATLLRPGITPDHPWADRRFVPVVLPAVVLFAVWTLSELCRRLPVLLGGRAMPWAASLPSTRDSARSVAWRRVIAVTGGIALVVPILLASAPLAFARTERGELAKIEQVCAEFQPGDVALTVDRRADKEWLPVLRGVCRVPAARILRVESDAENAFILKGVIAKVRAAGSNPVLVAATDSSGIRNAGLAPQHVIGLTTRTDARLLEARPDHTDFLYIDLWLGRG
jgi:hypothetical protein